MLLALYSKIKGRHAFIPCHQVGPPRAGPIEDTATCLPVSWHHATVCDTTGAWGSCTLGALLHVTLIALDACTWARLSA